MADVEAIVVVQDPPIAVTELGVQGPPGPPGAGGVATAHVHDQSSASAEWIINHNFGRRPIVELYTVGGLRFHADIVHTSDNQSRVYTEVPVAGFATLI